MNSANKNKCFGFLLAVLCFLMVAAASVPILNGILQSNLDGNQKCITNLDCLEADSITVPHLIVLRAGTAIQITENVEGRDFTISAKTNLFGGPVRLNDGYDLTAISNSTNYTWDCGRTNSSGEVLVNATLLATGNVNFLGPSNCVKWSELTLNVVATGGNQLITVPTNLPHFSTNNGLYAFTLAGTLWKTTLTNGAEFRLTIQSNSTLSTTWNVF